MLCDSHAGTSATRFMNYSIKTHWDPTPAVGSKSEQENSRSALGCCELSEIMGISGIPLGFVGKDNDRLAVSYQHRGDNQGSVAQRVRDVGPSSFGDFCDVQTIRRAPFSNLKGSQATQ